MRKEFLKIILSTFALFLLCIFAVLLFTSPALLQRLNLAETGNIGSTIGGLTAPLLGMITTILLYLTLNRQIDSIADQKIKNESDIVFMLLNQLDGEYNQFYLNSNNHGADTKTFGYEALTTYCNTINKFHNLKYSFKEYYTTDQILLIIRSFNLIEKRINLASVSKEMKELFKEKLNIFYSCRLKDPLAKLCEVFNTNEFLTDSATAEIELFHNKMKI